MNKEMTSRDNAFTLVEIQSGHVIDEYNKELKALEREMDELCDFAREHSYLLKQQGEGINRIEKSTISADLNVAEGTKTLAETDQKYNKIEMTKSKIAVITVCGLTGACIGGPLGLAASSSIATGIIGGLSVGGMIGSFAGLILSRL